MSLCFSGILRVMISQCQCPTTIVGLTPDKSDVPVADGLGRIRAAKQNSKLFHTMIFPNIYCDCVQKLCL